MHRKWKPHVRTLGKVDRSGWKREKEGGEREMCHWLLEAMGRWDGSASLLDPCWTGVEEAEGGRAACSAWQESQLHRSLPVMRERTGCHIKGPGGESVHGMEGFCQLKSQLHLFLYNHFMNLCRKWTVLVSGVVKYLTRKNSKEEGLLCSQSKQLSIVHHGGTAGCSASTLAGV